MAGSIDRRGVTEVIEGFEMFNETSNSPKYSVWQGKNCLKFCYAGENVDEARELLENNLKYVEAARSEAIFTIRLHSSADKDGMISDKTPYYGSFNFKVYSPYDVAPGTPGATVPQYVYQANEKIRELEAKIDKLTTALEQGSVGDVSGKMEKEEFVLALMENPLIQGLAGILMNKLTGTSARTQQRPAGHQQQQQQRPQQSRGLAGVDQSAREKDQEAKAIDAVNRLYQVDKNIGDNLQKLADMAETNPDKYKMALNLL